MIPLTEGTTDMLTRSKIESGFQSRHGLVVAAALVAILVACADASAPKPPDDLALLAERATWDSRTDNPPPAAAAEPSDSVFVGPSLPRAQPWLDFDRSVAGAAVPSCLDSRAAQHALFVAEGLLSMPFLVSAAADGACR
jgi:hypothetical protein